MNEWLKKISWVGHLTKAPDPSVLKAYSWGFCALCWSTETQEQVIQLDVGSGWAETTWTDISNAISSIPRKLDYVHQAVAEMPQIVMMCVSHLCLD